MKKTLVFAVLALILLSNVNAFACGMKDHSETGEGSEKVSEKAAE